MEEFIESAGRCLFIVEMPLLLRQAAARIVLFFGLRLRKHATELHEFRQLERFAASLRVDTRFGKNFRKLRSDSLALLAAAREIAFHRVRDSLSTREKRRVGLLHARFRRSVGGCPGTYGLRRHTERPRNASGTA